MCTLYAVPSSFVPKLIPRLREDSEYNPDGFSAVGVCTNFSTPDGPLYRSCIRWRFQTLDFREFASFLKMFRQTVDTVCVHLRAATAGHVGIPNCHFFDTPDGNWTYCHNGIIPCTFYRVDSLAIGDQLNGRIVHDLPNLPYHWDYANVIAIHNASGAVYVHRSQRGKMYCNESGTMFGSSPFEKWVAYDQIGWIQLDSGSIVHS